jgi:3-mercaptopyruvate sulfurtransferase SseA
VRQDPDEVTTWAANLPKNKKIVLYCQKEGTIVRVARKLSDLGFKQVLALKGGWSEWDKAGYPTEPQLGSPKMPRAFLLENIWASPKVSHKAEKGLRSWYPKAGQEETSQIDIPS